MKEITTVGEITEEHYGWIIEVKDHNLLTGQRDIYLIKHRTWEHKGQKKVGLVDKLGTARFTSPRIIGTEVSFTIDTSCRLVRQWCDPKKLKWSRR